MVELGISYLIRRDHSADFQGAIVITVVAEHIHIAVPDGNDNEPEPETGLWGALCAIQVVADYDDDRADVSRKRPDPELRQRGGLPFTKLQVTVAVSQTPTPRIAHRANPLPVNELSWAAIHSAQQQQRRVLHLGGGRTGRYVLDACPVQLYTQETQGRVWGRSRGVRGWRGRGRGDWLVWGGGWRGRRRGRRRWRGRRWKLVYWRLGLVYYRRGTAAQGVHLTRTRGSEITATNPERTRRNRQKNK